MIVWLYEWKIKVLTLLSFIIFLSACQDKNRIPEDTFIKIYTDFLIAQDTTLLTSTGLDSLRTSIFQKYNIDSNLYESTIKYYNEDAKRWEEFFDKVIAYIEMQSLEKK